MAHVVGEACIGCRYTECVAVCPQDAFREGTNFLVIDPLACANCGLCAMMCPVEAIYPDYSLPKAQEQFREINKELAAIWPVARVREPPADAHLWAKRTGKIAALSREPYDSSE